MPETEASTSTHERLIWRVAEVAKIVDETPRVKSLVLDVPGWPGSRLGGKKRGPDALVCRSGRSADGTLSMKSSE